MHFHLDSVDADTGSVTLSEGQFTVNGRLAVAFAGRVDDSDGDGVPGENLTVTFKGGETATLEEILSGSDLFKLARHALGR